MSLNEEEQERQKEIIKQFLIFNHEPREDGKFGTLFPMTLTQMIAIFLILLSITVWVVINNQGELGKEKPLGQEKTEQVQ